mmetsp:Transcript_21077/g.58536  ORF Transcript_21077/g.58536 Transcript_21077/m.58536 type:complete len:200 (-) Transcript_21077:321-920(-)
MLGSSAMATLMRSTTLMKYSWSSRDNTCWMVGCTCTDCGCCLCWSAPSAAAAAPPGVAGPCASWGRCGASEVFAPSLRAPGGAAAAAEPAPAFARFADGLSRGAFSGMAGCTPLMKSQCGMTPTSTGGRAKGASTSCSMDSSLSCRQYRSGWPAALMYFAGSLLLNPYRGSALRMRKALFTSSTLSCARLECLANFMAS